MTASSARALAFLAISTLSLGTAVAVGSPAAGAQAGTQVTLLNLNDFHGRISASNPSTLALADTVQKQRAAAGGADASALLSAGDNIGASLFASAYKNDQPTIDVLNALGLKASAVGNHEFDKGVADLTGRVIPAAKWDYVGANVTVGGAPLKEYSIQDIAGVKVAVVGAVTQDTANLVSPAGLVGVQFSDPVAAVNRVADQLRDGNPANGEADVVVAEYHDGSPVGTSLADGEAQLPAFKNIVEGTNGNVSAIFTAHTHQAYTWDGPKPGGGTRPVVQTGSYGANLGKVVLTVDPATKKVTGYSQSLVPVPTSATGANLADPVVADVKRIVDATLADAAAVGNTPVGTVKGDITTAYTGTTRDDRMSESALGNLVSDFMVEAVADRGGADIALMNPGGLRAELLDDPAGADGNITKAEANAVLPFANTIVTQTMTGAQIRGVLEQQWQPAAASRPFLALGTNKDLTWTFDPTRPTGDHITSITLKGAPLEAAASYKVVAQSFLAAGGDNFTEMAKASNVKDTGKVDSEAWQEYLAAHRAAGLSPSFAKHAVAVKNLPATVAAGTATSTTLADLALTSKGATPARMVTVKVDGTELTTVATNLGVDTTTFGPAAFPTPLDGSAALTFTLPTTLAGGAHTLTFVADNGTTVTRQVTVTGGGVAPQEGTGSLSGLSSAGGPAAGSLGSLTGLLG